VAAITGDSVGYAIGTATGESLMKLPYCKRRRGALDRALKGSGDGVIYVFIGDSRLLRADAGSPA